MARAPYGPHTVTAPAQVRGLRPVVCHSRVAARPIARFGIRIVSMGQALQLTSDWVRARCEVGITDSD